MRYPRKRGSTSVIVRIFIPDNSSAKGAGLTGLTNASTNLAIAFSREMQNGGTEITGANLAAIATIGTWANPGSGKLGFGAVDGTKFPGLYEIQFPDDCAAFGTGDLSQSLYLNAYEKTTTVLNIGPNMVLIPLVPWDYQDGVRMGLTALPNAVPGANGGLPTTNGTKLNQTADLSADGDFNATQKESIETAAGASAADIGLAVAAAIDIPTTSEIATAVGSAQPAESYAARGALPTRDQFLFMIWQFLNERAIAGTVQTTKKVNGSTAAMTHTYDSATAPTSITRTA
jgi:hypothetical protein